MNRRKTEYLRTRNKIIVAVALNKLSDSRNICQILIIRKLPSNFHQDKFILNSHLIKKNITQYQDNINQVLLVKLKECKKMSIIIIIRI